MGAQWANCYAGRVDKLICIEIDIRLENTLKMLVNEPKTYTQKEI